MRIDVNSFDEIYNRGVSFYLVEDKVFYSYHKDYDFYQGKCFIMYKLFSRIIEDRQPFPEIVSMNADIDSFVLLPRSKDCIFYFINLEMQK